MTNTQQLAANDPLLRELIEASCEAERSSAIERLLGEAKPVIASILIRSRSTAFRREDFDDLTATVLMRLVRRLRLAASVAQSPITSFKDFTASLTYNAVYELFRVRFPLRTRHKNRLRYVLSHDDRFAAWLVANESVAGLRSWRDRTDVMTGASITMHDAEPRMLGEARIGDAIEAVLTRFGRPLLLSELTDILAELWGITDAVPDEVPEARDAATPYTCLEAREQLDTLWREVKELPPQQRAALLLNLRDADGMNALALFILLDVATFDELASVLEMTTEYLQSIWSSLPLDDLTIGAILGKARQQVINLRKSARMRLARRMK